MKRLRPTPRRNNDSERPPRPPSPVPPWQRVVATPPIRRRALPLPRDPGSCAGRGRAHPRWASAPPPTPPPRPQPSPSPAPLSRPSLVCPAPPHPKQAACTLAQTPVAARRARRGGGGGLLRPQPPPAVERGESAPPRCTGDGAGGARGRQTRRRRLNGGATARWPVGILCYSTGMALGTQAPEPVRLDRRPGVGKVKNARERGGAARSTATPRRLAGVPNGWWRAGGAAGESTGWSRWRPRPAHGGIHDGPRPQTTLSGAALRGARLRWWWWLGRVLGPLLGGAPSRDSELRGGRPPNTPRPPARPPIGQGEKGGTSCRLGWAAGERARPPHHPLCGQRHCQTGRRARPRARRWKGGG